MSGVLSVAKPTGDNVTTTIPTDNTASFTTFGTPGPSVWSDPYWLPAREDKLITALVSAQADIRQPVKNATNPHFKNKFADLGECFDCVRAPLAKHGLVVTQLVQTMANGEVPYLETKLLHSSGQNISSDYPLPKDATPQQMGSAITYAKRYALCAMLGLVADEDEDANEATREAAERAAQARLAFVAKTAGGK